LRSLLRARLLSPAEAAALSNIDPSRFDQLCTGESEPSWDERDALAAALGISVRDLLPRRTAVTGGVSIQPGADVRRWLLPDPDAPAYRLGRLAGDPIHPDTSSFEITVLSKDDPDPELLRSHQHSYLYLLDGEVRLRWSRDAERHEELLRPGDSAYALPGIGLSFASTGDRPATVLLLRIGGAVTADVRYALGGFADRHLSRYLREDQRWYRAEGRSAEEVEERGAQA
ncbi:MAG: XRE family transcriptional regulator, partial [Actinomycetota bacterium]|nr:XRE family transcriptional regulator [Actinomycetota bacterium]